MLYKIKVCNGCWQKKLDKKYLHEKELKPGPKLYCHAKYWILGQVMWTAKRQRQKYKPLQSIHNFMHGLEHVTKGVMQKQARVNDRKCKNAY